MIMRCAWSYARVSSSTSPAKRAIRTTATMASYRQAWSRQAWPGYSRVLDRGGGLQAELLDRDLAHLDLADLAGDGHREGLHDLHVPGHLVVRQLAGAELAQRLRGHRLG